MSDADTMDLAGALQLLAVSRNDEAAWSVLHRTLWPYVFAVAYRKLGGAPATAEDAAQETFLRLVRYAPFAHLQDPSDMRAYVATVARHVVHDVAAREAKRPERPTAGGPAEDQSREPSSPLGLFGPLLPEDTLVRVRGLLEPQEMALLDLVVQGNDVGAVARHLGIRYGTAAVRIHRLRNRLRKLLVS